MSTGNIPQRVVRRILNTVRTKSNQAQLAWERLCWASSGIGIPLRENERRLARLRNREAGKRIFILANGPSLHSTDVDRLCGEATIASNAIFLLFDRKRFRPRYYTIEDYLVAEDRGKETASLGGCCKIFPADVRRFIPVDEHTIFVDFPRLHEASPKFSGDARRRIYWGGTVSYMNMQLAYYLGAAKIYLVGFDHNYQAPDPRDKVDGYVITSAVDDRNHFDPRYFGAGYRWHDPNVARMENAYRVAYDFLRSRGVEIFNATAGGKLEVFPRVDFESLF